MDLLWQLSCTTVAPCQFDVCNLVTKIQLKQRPMLSFLCKNHMLWPVFNLLQWIMANLIDSAKFDFFLITAKNQFFGISILQLSFKFFLTFKLYDKALNLKNLLFLVSPAVNSVLFFSDAGQFKKCNEGVVYNW